MPDKANYNFSGIATAYDLLCGDGRLIKHGAFDWQDGQIVPMVWRHQHSNPTNFLGHGILKSSSSPSGMRVLAFFNRTTEGQHAKQMVEDKEIQHLSIWANELTENSLNHSKYGTVMAVQKGTIREFSLVRSGHNPGALIDDVISHSIDAYGDEVEARDGVIVHTEIPIEIFEPEPEPDPEPVVEHAEDPEPEPDPEPDPEPVVEHAEMTGIAVLESLNEEQRTLFNVILHSAMTGESPSSAEGEGSEDAGGSTLKEVYDSLSEDQKNILHLMAGELSQSNLSQGDTDMPQQTLNIFEDGADGTDSVHFSHEDVRNALDEAISTRTGSLKATFLQHSITDIDFMFPDARNVDAAGPQFLTREMSWVEKVLNATSQRPFARIKSMYADLTPADARAKGYVTAAQKAEEVIAVLKRVTTPQTIYKLQKLDRDDIIDITEFDVVVWLKSEMRLMLREELARAILISDGRSGASADKIIETNVRPIYNDDAAFTRSFIYNDISNEQDLADFTAAEVVDLVDAIAAELQFYRGKGQPIFYCQPEVLTKLLLVRDANNLRIHKSLAELAEALRVSAIIDIPPMSGMEATGQVDPTGLPAGTYDIATLGVIVNLQDYVIGLDKGGQTAFFDDFDIDYNKMSYLYETRLSGALVNPLSAIAVQLVTAKTA
jgi:hypothetical protein